MSNDQSIIHDKITHNSTEAVLPAPVKSPGRAYMCRKTPDSWRSDATTGTFLELGHFLTDGPPQKRRDMRRRAIQLANCCMQRRHLEIRHVLGKEEKKSKNQAIVAYSKAKLNALTL